MSTPSPSNEADIRKIQAHWTAIRTLAPERFDAYRKPDDADDLDALARYVWNVDVSQALHPKLHALEVTFRNQLHNALSLLYGPTWYDRPNFLRRPELDKVATAKADLTRMRRPHDPGRIVAALSFGFWTALYGSAYDTNVGRRTIRRVLPFYPGGAPTRNLITPILRDIRFLRNRVSHFEPIVFDPNLPRLHQEADQLIRWMNPSMGELSGVCDRFSAVYGQTWTVYRSPLEKLFC